MFVMLCCFFFKQKTAYELRISDWSSDVCSSDLGHGIASNVVKHGHSMILFEHPGNQPLNDLIESGARTTPSLRALADAADVIILCVTGTPRSAERRVEKDCVRT